MKYRALAVITNLAAAVLLTALVTTGIYVTTIKHYVGRFSTNNYPIIRLDTTYWNVGCTIVGTAIGTFTVIAFAMQDECLTRHELVTERGVVAMFLRPLTIKRGGNQVARLQLPLERTLFVLLTLTAALSSATVVALFGVRSVSDVVVNPLPSFELAAFDYMDYTFIFQDKDGGLSPEGYGMGFNTPVKALLAGFLYKAAYIAGLKARGQYQLPSPSYIHLPEQSQIGSNTYETLYTGGIGLNVSSYLQYTGMTEGFSMSADFSFNRLEAIVYGTHVDVTCTNVTSEYSVETDDIRVEAIKDWLYITVAKKPGGPNFTFSYLSNENSGLEIESLVVVDRSTSEPTLFLAVHRSLSFLILGCKFTGREYRASVSVASVSSALQLGHEIDQGPLLDPIVQQHLANTSYTLFGHDGVGVVQGFLDADFDLDSLKGEAMISSLQTVLEQLGEAYISYIRQTVEKSNLYTKSYMKGIGKGTRLQLYVTVVRLGGASYGWLAVPVLLLLGTAAGVLRICTYRMLADFEAQDAVELLQSTMQTAVITDTSRIEYQNGELLELRSS